LEAVHALSPTKAEAMQMQLPVDRPAEATLFADGGSRGNPGPAASGAVLLDGAGELIEEAAAYLGVKTNNVAEWTALLLGLEAASKRGIRRLAIRLDSELVVKQLRGEYRVKHPDLQPLHRRAVALLRRFDEIDLRHVPRKQNVRADRLVNRVLDREAAAPAT
jgi:ribonuclease HI